MTPGEHAAQRAIDANQRTMITDSDLAKIADSLLEAANVLTLLMGPCPEWRRLMTAHQMLCGLLPSPRASGSTVPKGRSGAGHPGPSGTSGAGEAGR